MTFGQKHLDLSMEYAQAKEARSGAWELTTTGDEPYAGREPGDIAAEYERVVLELVADRNIEG